MSEKSWKVGGDMFGAVHVYTGDGERLTNAHMCGTEGWDDKARLIAAAPDLLAWLEAAVKYHAIKPGFETLIVEADEIIAKAKGLEEMRDE